VTQQTKPLDPDSPIDQEPAGDLTLIYDEIAEEIAGREKQQAATDRSARLPRTSSRNGGGGGDAGQRPHSQSPTGGRVERILFTLEEVAEMTGFALEPLRQDARDGRIEHVHRGRERYMTRAQIDKLIDRCTVRGTSAAKPRSIQAERDTVERDRRRTAGMQADAGEPSSSPLAKGLRRGGGNGDPAPRVRQDRRS